MQAEIDEIKTTIIARQEILQTLLEMTSRLEDYVVSSIICRALKERAPKSGAPGAHSYFGERSLERAPFENTGAEAGARSYF